MSLLMIVLTVVVKLIVILFMENTFLNKKMVRMFPSYLFAMMKIVTMALMKIAVTF